MKAFSGWFGRNILLPIFPAAVGSALRSVFSGHWSLESVDVAELSFCVALVGLFALKGVTRLSDKQLSDALSPLFTTLVAFALCLFAGSLLIVAIHQDEQVDLIRQLNDVRPVNLEMLASVGAEDRCTRIESSLRFWSLITCLAVILLAVLARLRYGIEDDDFSQAPKSPFHGESAQAASMPSAHQSNGGEK